MQIFALKTDAIATPYYFAKSDGISCSKSRRISPFFQRIEETMGGPRGLIFYRLLSLFLLS